MADPDADPAAPNPLDGWDPRFDGVAPDVVVPPRRLVRSRGPGPDPEEPLARALRIALPVVFFAGVIAVIAVFSSGLQPGRQDQVVGAEAAVRAAVAERPKRTCFNDNNPCAWLTVVDGRLVAFNTNGPLTQEYGRAGVGWCPTSGWFGANATGSRWDQAGRLARGPAMRGLDRFGLSVVDGDVLVDFTRLTTGVQRDQVTDISPATGPDCETIPFDRDADLILPAGS